MAPIRKQIREFNKIRHEFWDDQQKHSEVYNTYKHDSDKMIQLSLERMRQSRISKSQ